MEFSRRNDNFQPDSTGVSDWVGGTGGGLQYDICCCAAVVTCNPTFICIEV